MTIQSDVPTVRICSGHGGDGPAAPCESGDYVLYWMTAFRRPRWNFSLQRAIDWCRELDKPLVILEALRVDYRWASDRFHTFVVQGMADNHDAFADVDCVCHYPYLDTKPRRGERPVAHPRLAVGRRRD